ncbi:zinc finger and BTB domain-containing protein 12 [Pelodiscus sinensis]|uniref:zinc finger and BTB domain-containing protein 12 n=1 Tax=Pelodiscus sinensis TaxID=13735 RepID=UPI003F6D1508
MASGVELLRFQLPGHEAATLRNMNQLRSEERFCDVTIVAESLKFRGHKVILAACSPFLRDQFLLNPSSELQVSLMHSARIVADLLLSCYTGALEFAVRDIVNYLTAASYLQMEHVVEKCRNALSQFIEPQIGLKEDTPAKGGSAPPRRPPPLLARAPEWARKRLPPRPLKLELEELELKDEEEEEEEAYGDEDAVSDICIVKVESALEVAQRQKKQQQQQQGGGWAKEGSPPPSWAKAPEPEEAQVNSTVAEGPVPEAVAPEPAPQGVVKACYSLAEDAESEGLLLFPGGGYGEEGGRAPGPPPLRPVRCAKCQEAFQGVEKLVFHMRAQHFIFMCPRCGKQFNHSSNLNRHMNVHRGVKSHSCAVCGKSFTQKSTLHDHMNLHSGQRPYRCSYCDVRFAHKPAIRRHLKEQHGKTTAENVLEASVSEINVLLP